MTGLYIHIPLCRSRCRYCDFYKVTPNQWDGADRFLNAIDLELSLLPESFKPDTMFIGGGTPSALSAIELDQFFTMPIKQYKDYPNDSWLYNLGSKLLRFLGNELGGKL